VGFDNGKEFKWLFAELCENFGLRQKPTTDYNPQANAILERVHQVLGNQLRTFELEKEELPKENPFEPFLTATAYAIRSTYHTTLQATPGQLVFGRDMILPIQFKANWASIALRKQKIINQSNAKENKKRLQHEYKIGDKVLLEKGGIQPKMAAPREGPFRIVKVSANGTVRIQKGAVTQRVNIRRLTPYFERRPSGSG
jgi:preprotein translocase subunit YajC